MHCINNTHYGVRCCFFNGFVSKGLPFAPASTSWSRQPRSCKVLTCKIHVWTFPNASWCPDFFFTLLFSTSLQRILLCFHLPCSGNKADFYLYAQMLGRCNLLGFLLQLSLFTLSLSRSLSLSPSSPLCPSFICVDINSPGLTFLFYMFPIPATHPSIASRYLTHGLINSEAEIVSCVRDFKGVSSLCKKMSIHRMFEAPVGSHRDGSTMTLTYARWQIYNTHNKSPPVMCFFTNSPTPVSGLYIFICLVALMPTEKNIWTWHLWVELLLFIYVLQDSVESQTQTVIIFLNSLNLRVYSCKVLRISRKELI